MSQAAGLRECCGNRSAAQLMSHPRTPCIVTSVTPGPWHSLWRQISWPSTQALVARFSVLIAV